jgi:hypothetical protein
MCDDGGHCRRIGRWIGSAAPAAHSILWPRPLRQ